MALTVTQAQGILKTRYPSMKIQFAGYKDNVLFSLLPKDQTFTGDYFKVPINWGGNAAGSHVFATAQANKTSGKYDAFLLSRVRDYALGSISTEAIKASMSDVGAFLKVVTPETDNTIRQCSHSLNIDLFRNGGGARGQVGSVSTTTLTLKEPSDVVHFEVGMKVVSDDTDGTAGGADDGQALTITAIDRSAGTLVTSVTWTAGGNFSNDDYLFREGDFGVAVSGLAAWLPSSAPSATTFFNVDRSVDSRLGGLRYTGTSESIEEALISAETSAHVNGAKLSHYIMNTADLGDLRKSLGSRVEYERVGPSDPAMAKIGFRGIVLAGAAGDVVCVGDRDCPKGIAYGLQMDTWKFYSLGAAPQFLTAMGQDSSLWDYNADSVEFRIGWYGQLGCSDPGKNIRVSLPTG